MDKLLYLLPILACPIMMGAMMWFMMRGNNTTATATPVQPDPNIQEDIAVLRAEIATLRAQSGPTAQSDPSARSGRDHHTASGSAA